VALVLVATANGVISSRDGERAAIDLEGRRVTGLARRSHEWLAIADDHTVVRRSADGSWSELGRAAAGLTCVLPAPGGAWCGTADGQLLRLHEGTFTPSDAFARVDGRAGWHAVGSRLPYVRSLSATRGDRALLASVHVGGIPRSGNGGATWKPTIDPDADVHEVLAHPSDPNLVLAAAAVGLAVSRDAALTWAITTEGLHATYLRAVAYTRGSALVSACDGPFGSRGALYRWDTLTGGRLDRVTGSLPEWLAGNVDTGKLDADGTVAAFADGEAVYRSDDGGVTWSRLPHDGALLDPARVTAVGVAQA
jgi:hypothetical protein